MSDLSTSLFEIVDETNLQSYENPSKMDKASEGTPKRLYQLSTCSVNQENNASYSKDRNW